MINITAVNTTTPNSATNASPISQSILEIRLSEIGSVMAEISLNIICIMPSLIMGGIHIIQSITMPDAPTAFFTTAPEAVTVSNVSDKKPPTIGTSEPTANLSVRVPTASRAGVAKP